MNSVSHLFLVDSANDRIGGSVPSSSSSSLKLTFGRLPFCLPGIVHPLAVVCKGPVSTIPRQTVRRSGLLSGQPLANPPSQTYHLAAWQ